MDLETCYVKFLKATLWASKKFVLISGSTFRFILHSNIFVCQVIGMSKNFETDFPLKMQLQNLSEMANKRLSLSGNFNLSFYDTTLIVE